MTTTDPARRHEMRHVPGREGGTVPGDDDPAGLALHRLDGRDPATLRWRATAASTLVRQSSRDSPGVP